LVSQIRHVYPNAKVPEELAERIREAVDLRNDTIHYESKPEEMGPHPIEGLTTTWVMRTYTYEAAFKSVETLADVVSAALKTGRSNDREARWWAQQCRGVGQAIRKRASVPVDVTP
jgi:hypothetical protein